MEKKFVPSEEFASMVKVGRALRYVGEFLLQKPCEGYEARMHAEAIDMVKSQFDEVDKQIAAHPEYSAWKEEQQRSSDEKTQAQHEAMKEKAAAAAGAPQPEYGFS